jgi:hypothetical protein
MSRYWRDLLKDHTASDIPLGIIKILVVDEIIINGTADELAIAMADTPTFKSGPERSSMLAL